ncbi:MAG: UvrB/UvrC motif-containing protein [Verrucomicrobiales bacterium]|nr:UvrB/UvrC motif-containing protein [Verrucomicrobiales bacterium]
MTCDSCQKKNASIYLTQLVDGKMQKVNLCEQCAEEKGVTDPTGFALADLLKGTGTESDAPSAVMSDDGDQCSQCGFTQSDFKKTGRFGCSHCYEVFHAGLDHLLEAMHRHSEHRGKKPLHFIDTRSAKRKTEAVLADITELKELLNEAITVEDYEEAARLRDSISQLKKAAAKGHANEGADSHTETEAPAS